MACPEIFSGKLLNNLYINLYFNGFVRMKLKKKQYRGFKA